jgi:hypothetical protein
MKPSGLLTQARAGRLIFDVKRLFGCEEPFPVGPGLLADVPR